MTPIYQTRAVLAAAYRGKRRDLGATHTHVIEIDAAGKETRALCGRVNIDNVADEMAQKTDAPASCDTCFRRDPRRTENR